MIGCPHPDLASLDLPSPAGCPTDSRAGEGQATAGRGGEGNGQATTYYQRRQVRRMRLAVPSRSMSTTAG
mgnify:CR=1 FL=1